MRGKVIIFTLLTAVLLGQLIPYYGKNKVIYNAFKWKIYETDHFRIHFYHKDRKALAMVSQIVEEAYQKLSVLTGIKIDRKITEIRSRLMFIRSLMEMKNKQQNNGALHRKGAIPCKPEYS